MPGNGAIERLSVGEDLFAAAGAYKAGARNECPGALRKGLKGAAGRDPRPAPGAAKRINGASMSATYCTRVRSGHAFPSAHGRRRHGVPPGDVRSCPACCGARHRRSTRTAAPVETARLGRGRPSTARRRGLRSSSSSVGSLEASCRRTLSYGNRAGTSGCPRCRWRSSPLLFPA